MNTGLICCKAAELAFNTHSDEYKNVAKIKVSQEKGMRVMQKPSHVSKGIILRCLFYISYI